MRVETTFQTIVVTDIPNVENLTSVAFNLQDMTVEFLYKGYEHRPWALPEIETVEVQHTGPRYDGELDDPDHPVRRS